MHCRTGHISAKILQLVSTRSKDWPSHLKIKNEDFGDYDVCGRV